MQIKDGGVENVVLEGDKKDIKFSADKKTRLRL